MIFMKGAHQSAKFQKIFDAQFKFRQMISSFVEII